MLELEWKQKFRERKNIKMMLATSKQEGMLEKIGKLRISTLIITPYLKNRQQTKKIMEVNRRCHKIYNLYNNNQMSNKKT